MICPKCQTVNRDGAKFCDECGTSLVDLTAVPPVILEEPEESPVDATALSDLPSFDVEESPAEEPVVVNDEEGIGASEVDVDADTPADDESAETSETEASSDDAEQAEPEISDETDASDEPADDINGALAGLDTPSQVLFDVSQLDISALNSASETQQIPPVAESVVGADYQAPASAWKSGGTMEMPRMDTEAPASTNFVAPDPNDKKRRRKEARQLRKEQKAAEAAQRAASGQKSYGKRIGIAVALICVVAVAIAISTYQLEMWGGKTVADVTGMAQMDAKDTLEADGFQVRIDYVSSDDIEGLVLLTDPSAGTRVDEGSEIVITVAQSRVIPDVVMMTEEEARAALTAAGYTNIGEVEYVKSDEYDGVVTAISPDQGNKAKSTAKISMTVAQAYTVPDVSGMTEYEAIDAVKAAGYSAAVNMKESATVTEGCAIDTYPAAGEKVESGSTITINVSQSRATHLQELAKEYLSGLGTITLGVTSYEISSVDQVSYLGNNQVSFSLTGKPYTTFLGETIYLSSRTVTGTITYDDNDQVVSVS